MTKRREMIKQQEISEMAENNLKKGLKTDSRYQRLISVVIVAAVLVSCAKDPVVVLVTPTDTTSRVTPPPPDTTTVNPPEPECEDCGWGRLEGIPLLGYGEPVDRRVEARQHIEVVRQKLRALGWIHDYNDPGNPYTVREIALLYPERYRLYANARRMGVTGGERFQEFFNRILLYGIYPYLSDTVTIYIGGGPDYTDGIDHDMCLWQDVYKGIDGWTPEYDSSVYIPTSRWLMDRPFNQSHTSIIQVPHSTAGLLQWPGTRGNCTIQFFDFTTACGNFQADWPENILSYEDAGLVNDIGVELLRYTVELLQQQGKTIAFYGTSWGAYVMARYLLYYPIEDFERVVLAAFNPNNCKEQVEIDRYNINKFLETGRAQLGQELYEMCRWRMLPWLTKQDLSRLRLLMGREDKVVGFPTDEELKALTDAGATVIELPGLAHGIAVGSYQYALAPTDTAVRYTWENNMIIHTKNGVQVINNNNTPMAARKAYLPEPAPAAMAERNNWRFYRRNK